METKYVLEVQHQVGRSLTPETPFQKRYDVRHDLGRGNFATVKLSVDKQTGERCAVKVIDRRRFSLNAKLIQSFYREVEILRSLSHRHVVGFRDYFEEGDMIYLVQELVSGGDLLQYVNKRGRLKEHEAKVFFRQIIDVLKFLKTKQITHRDLKPDNFLITEDNTLKLADFGLAKGSHTGILNTVCGTPVYLSPEILSTKYAYDSRVDLYSSGVILFFLLSGKVPFNAATQAQVFNQIQRGHIDWSDKVWATNSTESIDLILKLMAIHPELRIELDQIESHSWLEEEDKDLAPSVSIDEMNKQPRHCRISCNKRGEITLYDLSH
ncbi:hypothetical protein HDU97_000639 [Phlyctochytrium planicorne]|nr:hypothetical protein HDU97_000639 [Phlyctochytrium planicorne]